MKKSPLLALAPVLVGASALRGDAESKYQACSLLTSAEIEAALREKVDRSNDSDIEITEGLYKGETMSSCVWVAGSTYVTLYIIRAPRTPEERAAGLARLRKAIDDLRQRGWVVETVAIAGAECSGLRPPTGATGLAPGAVCVMESKGLAFSLGVIGAVSLTPQQVRALADRVVARLP